MMQTTKPKMPCSTAQASSGRIGNIALNARAEAEIAAPPKTKVRIRGCANRSWSARRSSLPTVAAPCFPDQPPDDDDHLREGHPEIYHPPHPLCTLHQFLVGVVPRTRPLHNPPIGSPER